MAEDRTALENTRILDVSDDKSIYGVKLLADLGADTVRPEPLGGDPLRKRGPFANGSDESLWYAYFATSRRTFDLDTNSSASADELNALLDRADICFVGKENPLAELLNLEGVHERNPSLVIVQCTPFGSRGPWVNFKAPDLVAGALGGSVGVTGDDYTPPLKLFGDLNFTISGTYAAIAGLAGLRHAKRTGEGQGVEVPVHECIASSLEHVFMWYFYSRFFPHARAQALERRGSVHWTNLYEVMQTQNGRMMVTPTPNLDAQLAWLVEEGAFEDLLDPKYEEPGARREYLERFMQVIRDWVRQQDTETLFYEAQERHVPYGWVQSIEDVAQNPQLESRQWWEESTIHGSKVTAPGLPFRLLGTPGRVADSEWIPAAAEDIVGVLGWEESHETT